MRGSGQKPAAAVAAADGDDDEIMRLCGRISSTPHANPCSPHVIVQGQEHEEGSRSTGGWISRDSSGLLQGGGR